ncbi:MAG: transketolase C-terminal domain-containing protein, partial [bacterium]
RFKIGVGRILQDGDDITIITTGSMLHTGRHVSKMLADQNISARLISMPTVKPLDEKLVLESAKRTKAIFTIEEHSLIGGLGSAVCETLAESKHRVLVKRFALPDKYGKFIGDQQYLLAQRGLLPTQIAERINSIIGDI